METKPPTKQKIEREAHRLAWETIFDALPQEVKDRFEVTGKNEMSIEVEALGVSKWVTFTSKARTNMPGDKETPYCGVSVATDYERELSLVAAAKAKVAKEAKK